MECDETETQARLSPVEKIQDKDSSDNFQKFIYDLFDKNGILNDLRAYLRGHIVNVLKSAQTGEPPPSQKHYTQRLELASQAVNILIAEYLLQLEFTYSLSVFVSEIPLSNMIFDFAKNLLKDSTIETKLRFNDNDIWLVLNYLGVKCDSEHASNIVEMYKSDDRTPLLFCFLKCMPMYSKESVAMDEEDTSRDSLTSSVNSLDTVEKKTKVQRNTSWHGKCKHYTFCKSCQSRISKLKEKYRKRKKEFHQEARSSSMNPWNVESFMKNINVMEKRIIQEMFEQLQSVYEAEVEMVRREEEGRVRRTLATHALQLQRRRDEIEETLKTKEAELESSAQHKKQLLWGVARSLRERHEHVARAMTLLAEEREKLAQQETNLKTQLSQAEETLRQKGEEMRVQISKELEILEANLESMKRERDSLNKERSDLEHLKTLCDSKTRIIESHGEKEKEDMKQHYDLLRDEIAVLKKHIELTEVKPKCVVEKGTITEFVDAPSHASILNNINCIERHSKNDLDDREPRPSNRLVNDLRKPKNVNFSQTNMDEVYLEVCRGSRCSVWSAAAAGASGRGGVCERDDVQRLVRENESLRDYARQQRDQISASCDVPRPRTAPAPLPAANYFTVYGVNPSSSLSAFGSRNGAGEELGSFPKTPRLTEPPPLGLLRDRHADSRRHLINQWRALRRRPSPLARLNKTRPPVAIQLDTRHREITTSVERTTHRNPAVQIADEPQRSNHIAIDLHQDQYRQEPFPISKAKSREKSPKTVLKEAKENLRTKTSIRDKPSIHKREQSPNSMLREAKLRLRKLEIEAEAVEQSYLDFRKRQAELRDERNSLSMLQERISTDDVVINLDVNRSRSLHKITHNINQPEAAVHSKETTDTTKSDFDKYLRDYQTRYDIGETHFKNRNSAVEKAEPIPTAYSEVNSKIDKTKNVDYIETPIMEFRKLYHAEKERNMPQLRSYIGITTNAPRIHEECAIRESSIENLVKDSDKDAEIGSSKVNLINSEKERKLNAVKVENSSRNCSDNDTDINTNRNINNEIKESTKPKEYALELQETKLLEIQEKSDAEVIEYKKLETLRKIKNKKAAELEILKENINKIYNFTSPRSNIIPDSNDTLVREKVEHLDNEDKNVLRVEVESSCEVNKVKMSESGDDELYIVVQSTMSTKESDESEEEAILSIPLTVDVRPKDSAGAKKFDSDILDTPKSKRSDSPEKAAQLTRNDALDAIFHADDNQNLSNVSSVDTHDRLSGENVKENLSDQEKDPYGDYPDDFSADVDNYNSRSDYGNNSPISLPKSSENDNFWEN